MTRPSALDPKRIATSPRQPGDGYRAEFVGEGRGDPPVGFGPRRYDAILDLLMQVDAPGPQGDPT